MAWAKCYDHIAKTLAVRLPDGLSIKLAEIASHLADGMAESAYLEQEIGPSGDTATERYGRNLAEDFTIFLSTKLPHIDFDCPWTSSKEG